MRKYQAIITPIDISGERLGTLFIYKCDSQYQIDDIILSEYGTTVVGLEMMRSVNEENAEETRKVQIVKSAISTLSFSEIIAQHIKIIQTNEKDKGFMAFHKPFCRPSFFIAVLFSLIHQILHHSRLFIIESNNV